MSDLFPYPRRPGQGEMVDLIRDSVRGGKCAVIESGTGTGKTSVSLAGALEGTAGTARKVVFLTRTKSQQRQVAVEARAIGARTDILCVSVQGRGPATCPIMMTDRDLEDGTAEEMSKLCAELKKGTGPAGKCPYFENIGSTEVEASISFMRSEHPDPEEFRDFCIARGICPYETANKMLPYANVISAPYAFFFIPAIKHHFLQWLGISDREVVAIVDEAHNLPSYLRDIMTCRLSCRALDLADAEADRNGNPLLVQDISCRDLVQMMRDIIYRAQEEYLRRENDLIPPEFLKEEMMQGLGMTSLGIRDLVMRLAEVGARIEEEKKARRKLPRSHLSSLAGFISEWMSYDGYSHVFLICGGDNPYLEAYCLDPAEAAAPLRTCLSSVSMSGTLSPLDNYVRELDLGDAASGVFPSPFPKGNLEVLYVNDVSTKYSELNGNDGTYERIRKYIVDIVGASDRSTAVFFPSYGVMDRFVNDNVPADLRRDVYFERRGMPQSELMEQISDFRGHEGSVLFAVTGGRVSEGLDFPGKQLELAVIVGIPFARPSAKQDALMRYCQNRFGDGWDMAVRVPAVRKMRQTVGRLIRSENDRGVAVILDRRIASMEGLEATLTTDPVADVRRFFQSH